VIIPGFLSGSDTFAPMVNALAETYGIRAMVVPLTVTDWIPCLGGRSVRPILERIDATVQFMAAQESGNLPFRYNKADFWKDLTTNPGGVLKIGGTDIIDEYPAVEPAGSFPRTVRPAVGKIALIGHSAGGWIGRVYCSNRPFGGRSQPYNGSERIHSLITLGTPHFAAPGPAFAGIAWCDIAEEEADDDDPMTTLRRLAVAGSGFAATEWGTLTQNSYAFCGYPDVDTDGDGITPIASAVAWKGAEHMVIANVTHFPWSETTGANLVAPELTKDHKMGNRTWYGSLSVVQQWAKFLLTD
jgi:pimeloyl-ACP methyl ester carboxylesterase